MRWQDVKLFDAIKADDLRAAWQAIGVGADVNLRDAADRVPLQYVVDKRPELLTLLLKSGADANSFDEQGYTPLMHAIACKNYDAAAAMLAGGGDINAQNSEGFLTVLHSALFADLRDDDTCRVEFVLTRKPDLGLRHRFKGELMTALALAQDAQSPRHVALIEAAVDARQQEEARLAVAAAQAAARAADATRAEKQAAQARKLSRQRALSQRLRL